MTNRSASILILFSLAAAGVGSLTAHAQVSGRPDPGDPRTPTIADKPDSAFNGYKPFREQAVRSWKDANQEVADNPGMGSMANMPGMNMPGTDSKAAMPEMNMPGMKSKGTAGTNGATAGAMPAMAGMAGMDMSRKDSKAAMPGMNMPGMEPKGGAAPHGKPASAMRGMSAMPGMAAKGAAAQSGKAGPALPGMSAMPGMGAMPAKDPMPQMNMAGAEAKHRHGEAPMAGGGMPGMSAGGMASKGEQSPGARGGGSMPGMAMPGMGSKSEESENAVLQGTGVVRGVEKPAGKIQITHDPIAAVSWPRMTIVFRVKNVSLVEQVKQGDKVKFVLTRSSTGYVITDIKTLASGGASQTR